MDAVVTIKGLSKYYGSIKALHQFDLQIPRGTAFGILGPNGSGKTTLLGMLLDITKPNQGNFEWNLVDHPDRPRLGIGALLETPNFYPYLNAIQNLKITARIKNTDGRDIEEVLKMVNLWDRRTSKFMTYSLGMKQRLAIAAAMIGDPEVLIFDEPTNGLDPEGIAEIRNLILKIASLGKSIIMASHILDEVEKICSHVAIIRKGELLVHGTVGGILKKNEVIFEVKAQPLDRLESALRKFPQVRTIETINDHLLVTAEETLQGETLNKQLFDQGITLSHLSVKKVRLEDEFLNIIKSN
jgi:ABC-type multidrug transport system ATPase subunit